MQKQPTGWATATPVERYQHETMIRLRHRITGAAGGWTQGRGCPLSEERLNQWRKQKLVLRGDELERMRLWMVKQGWL